MVDFSLNETDRTMLDELRRQCQVKRKYTRYYDENEDEVLPPEFPEAKDFDHLPGMMRDRRRTDDTCSPMVFGILAHILENWGDSIMFLRFGNRGLGNSSLDAAGTDEQKEKWGQTMLSMANTEPGCGSDSKAIETTAVLEGDEWVLNGEKIFVSGGLRCKGVVVWATLDKSQGRGAIKSFVVMKGTPGLEVGHKEKKMGIRASDTVTLVLKDCRIPRENLLGGDEEIRTGGGGFKGLMKTFNATRPSVAARGIGVILACHEFVTESLKEEGVEVDWEAGPFKRSAVQEKLIELESLMEAANLVTLRAAWLMDNRRPNNLESSVSKAKGGDVARTGAQLAIELLGAAGITRDYLVEKWFRDVRITDIYEGTGEINRLVTARALLNYSSDDLM